jgi:hypothetical protein
VPAQVLHGNTLAWHIYEAAYTPAARHLVQRHGVLFP